MNRSDVELFITNLGNPPLINYSQVRESVQFLLSELGAGKQDDPFKDVSKVLIRDFAHKLAALGQHLMSIYVFKEFHQKCVELELSSGTRIHKGDMLYFIGLYYLQIPNAQETAFKYCILSFLEDVIAESVDNNRPSTVLNAMELGSAHLLQFAFHMPKINLERLREKAILILKDSPTILNSEMLFFYIQKTGYQSPRYNDYKYYNPSYPHLKDRYKEIKAKKDAKAWEEFAALLFSSVRGFESILDVKPGDRSYQFDVVIRNVSSYDFSIQWLGDYFALECKYYDDDSVGVNELNHFASKLLYHDFKCGIFFTRTPISGWKSSQGQQYGKLVQTKIFNRQGLIIFDFSENDIETILEGTNLIEVLFEKYEQVRLDL